MNKYENAEVSKLEDFNFEKRRENTLREKDKDMQRKMMVIGKFEQALANRERRPRGMRLSTYLEKRYPTKIPVS